MVPCKERASRLVSSESDHEAAKSASSTAENTSFKYTTVPDGTSSVAFRTSTSQWAVDVHVSTSAGTNKSRSKPSSFHTMKQAELKPLPYDAAAVNTFEMLRKKWLVDTPASFEGCITTDERRMRLVEALARCVGTLASLLKDFNDDRGPAARLGMQGFVIVECCDPEIEALIGPQAPMQAARPVTLHFFLEFQLKLIYLERLSFEKDRRKVLIFLLTLFQPFCLNLLLCFLS